jgi:hypothetical protein
LCLNNFVLMNKAEFSKSRRRVEFEGNHVLCPTQSEICVVIRKAGSDIYIYIYVRGTFSVEKGCLLGTALTLQQRVMRFQRVELRVGLNVTSSQRGPTLSGDNSLPPTQGMAPL